MQPVGCFHLAPPSDFPPSYSIIRYLPSSPREIYCNRLPRSCPFTSLPSPWLPRWTLQGASPARPPSAGGRWCDGSHCTWKVNPASCKQLYKSISSVFLPPFLPVSIVMRHTLLARKDFSPFYPLPVEKGTKIGKRRKNEERNRTRKKKS